AFSSNGETLAVLSPGGVALWDLSGEAPKETTRIKVAYQRYLQNPLALAPDGKTLATSDPWLVRAPRWKLWDLSGAEPKLRSDLEGCCKPAFSPDGKMLATLNWVNHHLKLWDVTQSEPKELADFALIGSGEPRFAPDG